MSYKGKQTNKLEWTSDEQETFETLPLPAIQHAAASSRSGYEMWAVSKNGFWFFFWIHRDLWALVFSNNNVSYDWIMFYFLFFLDKPPRGTAALVKGERNTSQDKIIEDLLKGGHIFFFSLSTNSMKRTNNKMFLFLSKNIRDSQQWSSVTQKIMLI